MTSRYLIGIGYWLIMTVYILFVFLKESVKACGYTIGSANSNIFKQTFYLFAFIPAIAVHFLVLAYIAREELFGNFKKEIKILSL